MVHSAVVADVASIICEALGGGKQFCGYPSAVQRVPLQIDLEEPEFASLHAKRNYCSKNRGWLPSRKDGFPRESIDSDIITLLAVQRF